MSYFKLLMVWLISYVRNIGVALDQLVNALLFGDPDETLSSRVAKCRKKACILFCYFLAILFLNPQHCKESVEADEGERDLLRKWLNE